MSFVKVLQLKIVTMQVLLGNDIIWYLFVGVSLPSMGTCMLILKTHKCYDASFVNLNKQLVMYGWYKKIFFIRVLLNTTKLKVWLL